MINFIKKFNLKKTSAADKNEKGATLIELLVAVIIFSAVMTAVIGILISAIKANNRIVAKQENIDSARYSMEYMIKELRMAKLRSPLPLTSTFDCINSVCNSIIFKNSVGAIVTYSLSAGKITRNGKPVSSDKVNVTALNFFVNDWNLTPGAAGESPLITIFITLRGTIGAAVNETVNLQSSVSPRIYGESEL